MANNQEIKKKRSYLSVIFWLGLLILIFWASRYLFNQDNFEMINKNALVQSESIIPPATNIKDNKPEQNQAGSETNADKEFYAALSYLQLQIKELQDKYDRLNKEVEKAKNPDKLSKIIISFVEMRNCIEARESCSEQLQKLEILSQSDLGLSAKIDALKLVLKDKPKSQEELKIQLNALIPNLMLKKPEIDEPLGLFENVKYHLHKFIVIRRVDGIAGNESENIDRVIFEVKKLINDKKYFKAAEILSNLPQGYQQVSNDMIKELKNAAELDRISNEIFSYLKLMGN
jgi:hypothetical protein